MARADIAVALLAKNAENTLGACLDSIRPYVEEIVVAVDETSEDGTPGVASLHGADKVVSIQVSTEHECPEHGKVLAQHFARARDESFTHLNKSHKWLAWIDSDDVLIGGELLAERLGKIGDAIGVWLSYEYATVEKDGKSQSTTTFHRERILRSDLEWKWTGRVHETVNCGLPGPWAGMGDVLVRHQPGGHKPGGSAMRNLLLLEIDLEENPNDQRAMFYLGNQYFAMGQWQAAIDWYARLAQTGPANPYELWQAYCYQSLAFLKLDDLDGAAESAFAAMHVIPDHPEPCFHLASAYARSGEGEKSLFWINQGRSRKTPPFFVFKNPLDYSYNNRLLAADVLAGMAQVTEARQELEAAYRVLPDETVGKAIERYRGMEEAANLASSFVNVAHGKSDEQTVALWETLQLPDEVREFGRGRDVVMPAYQRLRATSLKDRPSIVFWCGRSLESWAPPKLNETGIGGSETAVIEIARRFAADGYRVEVYNHAARYEGVYDGVGYWDSSRYEKQPCDVFVSWRKPDAESPAARVNLLWCHDLNYGSGAAGNMQRWDRVLGVSRWHSDYLRAAYGLGNADFVPNGIDLSRFPENVKKVPFRCVYASSPDRGLVNLLDAWPTFLQAEPAAELHVAYGWENYDKWIDAGNREMADFKARMSKKIEETPRVVWRGRLPQDQLAQLYAESYLWLYPATFLEVSCISAMEAMAGGAAAVTSAAGALPETIGGAGIVVEGYPHSKAWLQFWTHIAIAALTTPNLRMPSMYAGKERAKELTWDKAFLRWKDIVTELLEGRVAA